MPARRPLVHGRRSRCRFAKLGWVLTLCSTSALAAAPPPAPAKKDNQPASTAPAAVDAQATFAQRAFDEARALMAAGKFAQACVKFEESMRLEAGMATQFRLAQCYEKVGRVASAWRSYLDVAAIARDAGQPDRESFARKHADALAPRLSKIAIRVSAGVSTLKGLKVLHNGAEVPSARWGGLAVDPGTHRLRAEATGKNPWSVELEITTEGQVLTVKVPPLTDASGPSVIPLAAPPSTNTPSRQGQDQAEGPMHIRAKAGLAIGGVGIATLGAGFGMGLAAQSKWDESRSHCGTAIPENTGPNASDLCTQTGLDIRADGRGLGNIGTGLFIAGAATAVTGAVLWLTAPSTAESTARETKLKVGLRPGHDGAMLEFRGIW